MLGHRLRRCPNIKPTLFECLVFAGIQRLSVCVLWWASYHSLWWRTTRSRRYTINNIDYTHNTRANCEPANSQQHTAGSVAKQRLWHWPTIRYTLNRYLVLIWQSLQPNVVLVIDTFLFDGASIRGLVSPFVMEIIELCINQSDMPAVMDCHRLLKPTINRSADWRRSIVGPPCWWMAIYKHQTA